jgi:hypothetical protein
MKVAAEHAEGERTATRKKVKKRFLFDRVQISTGNIPPGYAQTIRGKVSYLADTVPSRVQQAAMAASQAANTIILHQLYQLPRMGEVIQTEIRIAGHSIIITIHPVVHSMSRGGDGFN